VCVCVCVCVRVRVQIDINILNKATDTHTHIRTHRARAHTHTQVVARWKRLEEKLVMIERLPEPDYSSQDSEVCFTCICLVSCLLFAST
jgi:hypothetical protein